MNLEIVFLYKLALLFGGIALVYLVFVFFIKGIIVKNRAHKKAMTASFSELLGEIVFFDVENATKKELGAFQKKKRKLRESIGDDGRREVLVGLMMKLQLDLIGEPKKALLGLYKELNLHLYAVQKLKSYRWEGVASAILELTQMEVEEAYIAIRAFTTDRRQVVRKQARTAIISLKEEGIGYFLDTATGSISEWQQLKVMEILKSKTNFDLPDFKNWFASANPDVVLLAVRLAATFDQQNSLKNIGTLLSHDNGLIREEVLSTISKFKMMECKPQIVHMFWEGSEDFKVKALHTIKALHDKKDGPFIQEVLQREKSGEIHDQALQIMELIRPEEPKKQWQVIENKPQAKKANGKRKETPPIAIARTGDPILTVAAKNTIANEKTTSLSVLSNFFEQDNFNKVLLLDATQKLMDFGDLPLLKKIVEKEGNLAIKIKALELLKLMGEKRLKERPALAEYSDIFN